MHPRAPPREYASRHHGPGMQELSGPRQIQIRPRSYSNSTSGRPSKHLPQQCSSAPPKPRTGSRPAQRRARRIRVRGRARHAASASEVRLGVGEAVGVHVPVHRGRHVPRAVLDVPQSLRPGHRPLRLRGSSRVRGRRSVRGRSSSVDVRGGEAGPLALWPADGYPPELELRDGSSIQPGTTACAHTHGRAGASATVQCAISAPMLRHECV
jgi:hypothetical protein